MHAPAVTTHAAGLLAAVENDRIILALPGTDYRLHLVLQPGPVPLPPIGDPLAGRIRARAQRVDVMPSGGRFIEPVDGRPRRLQGRIVALDPNANTLTIQCAPGCAICCTPTDPRQKPADFALGQLVGFDVEPGATFEPMKEGE